MMSFLAFFYLLTLLTVGYAQQYAINCGGNHKVTSICLSLHYGYSCGTDGQLGHTYSAHPLCDDHCRCIELATALADAPSLVENVRVDSEFAKDTTEPLHVEVLRPQADATSDENTREDVSTNTETTSEPNSASSALDLESRSLVKRNNYALNCYDNQRLTNSCQKSPYGYYCSKLGRLAWTGEEEELICGGCSCTNLFPAPKCFLAMSGAIVCKTQQKPFVDLSEPPTERMKQLTTLIAKPSPKTNTTTSVKSIPPTVVVRDVAAAHASQSAKASAKAPKYNNYAMSCLNERYQTNICQADPWKYYCDSNGRLRHQGKKDELYCELCECIDLAPKPNLCIANLIGVNCMRDIGDSEESEAVDTSAEADGTAMKISEESD